MTDPTALPSFGPAPTGHDTTPPGDDLRDRVTAALAEFGTNPELDSDGDIAFDAGGNRLFARCFPGEIDAVQILGMWTLADEVPDDELKQLQACNFVNMAMHLVKAAMIEPGLFITTEILTDSEEKLPAMLNMSIGTVLTALHVWHENVQGLEPGSTFPQPEGESPESAPEA